jgi:hypothetical protein
LSPDSFFDSFWLLVFLVSIDKHTIPKFGFKPGAFGWHDFVLISNIHDFLDLSRVHRKRTYVLPEETICSSSTVPRISSDKGDTLAGARVFYAQDGSQDFILEELDVHWSRGLPPLERPVLNLRPYQRPPIKSPTSLFLAGYQMASPAR